MAKVISLTGVPEAEAKELLAGLAARRRELDKAWKSCMKADAQAAAEKVHERMRAVDAASERIKEQLES